VGTGVGSGPDPARVEDRTVKSDEMIYADRSERAKLRVSGAQAKWFLHQILTQAFEDVEPGTAREAAMITAHGRMTGYLEAVATNDSILCHFEPELRASLIAEMSRYVFATQVELEDVTDDYGLVLIVGAAWGAAAAGVEGVLQHETRSLGVEAGYLWCRRQDAAEVTARAHSQGARPATEDELEALRIAHGRPRWGREMGPKTIPQEVGIDTEAVDYNKGCYLGQEAMAKIHFRGKVNRRLARVQGANLRTGADVFTDDTKVGTLTSAVDGCGLAMVRASAAPGSSVTVDGGPAQLLS
jgi:tRNA-modifying protein YgfZ